MSLVIISPQQVLVARLLWAGVHPGDTATDEPWSPAREVHSQGVDRRCPARTQIHWEASKSSACWETSSKVDFPHGPWLGAGVPKGTFRGRLCEERVFVLRLKELQERWGVGWGAGVVLGAGRAVAQALA